MLNVSAFAILLTWAILSVVLTGVGLAGSPPTRHRVNVAQMLKWVDETNGYPRDEFRKEKLRALMRV
jgi:hypothetical protein